MSIERVRAHFGFTRMPFQKDLAPQMLHHHKGHDEAVARIAWLVEENAIGVLTGEVGSGKTVALRAAFGALDGSRHSVIYLGNPSVGARGLYQAIVSRLGGTPRFHKAALIPQTAALLHTEIAERGRRVVLAVDEAHLLDAAQLEELRLLTNAEMDSVSPFALLLSGQPPFGHGSGSARSRRSTSASPSDMRSEAWSATRLASTYPTTCASQGDRTRSFLMTPSIGSTKRPGGCHGQ